MTTAVHPGKMIGRASPARPDHRWGVALPIALYAVLGLVAYFPTWPGDPSRIPQCTCADAGLNAWFLAATAHAVAHGHSLFFTSELNYPVGLNLTYNAQMPLLGLITAPLTLTAGPIASLNLLMWLAFPLSASSMFLVLRRWTSWTPAAFAGGLLYGFSPYMVGQSTAHLHLLFVPLPPLIMLVVAELFVRRTGNPRWWGLALGLLTVGQFLISSEVLVTTALVTLVGLAMLAAARPGQIVTALRFAAGGLLTGLLAVAVVLAYPIWVFFAGPEHYTARVTGGAFLIRSDLLAPLVPTSLERFAPAGWAAHGNHLTPFLDYSENGSYLGLPFLLLLAYLAARAWRSRWVRFATAMAGITFVLSLGSPLTINGHRTGVPLPDALLEHLPLVDLLLPSRISLFTALFVGVMVALGLDELRRHRQARPRDEDARPTGRETDRALGPARRVVVVVLAATVTVAAVVALVPRWPNRTVRADVPSYFTSRDIDRIAPGTVALTYPYATPLHAQPMVWQAVTDMRFSLIGGYALIPDARGVPVLFPSTLQPAAVQRFFVNQMGGVPFYDTAPVADNHVLVVEVRRFILRYRVGVVLIDPATRNAHQVELVMRRALGQAPVASGGIVVWYGVQTMPALTVPPP
jgi:hypothetical protein